MTKRYGLTREMIARRVAKEFKDGMYVNLGFGLPMQAVGCLPEGTEVLLHSENGIIGYSGVISNPEEADSDLVMAAGKPTKLVLGASIFDLNEAFVMIRGGHIDLAVLGAYQVSEAGDLANWSLAQYLVGGVGGSLELAFGAKRVIVAMEHTTSEGDPKILRKCTLPLTAPHCVNTIVTDLGVIEVTPKGLELLEVAPGITPQDVQDVTEPKLILAESLREMEFQEIALAKVPSPSS